ncbi:MAG TPA: hypothetical protein VHD61_14825 [Lacunisphaera sp.]|nr:hypothetical protein [Lacunisphaera sp.]
MKATEDKLLNTEQARRYTQEAMQPAEVVVHVTKFNNILIAEGPPAKRNTENTMEMIDGKDHPRVRRHDGKLKIRPGGATIRFHLTPDDYYPIGISFMRMADPSDPDAAEFTPTERLGTLNFGQVKICPVEHTLDVTDHFKDEEEDDQYKFSLIIQEAKTGAIGIIDPIIEHEGEN